MADQSVDMTSKEPPLWLRRALLLVLSVRDRETIFGDLLEEYQKEHLPSEGSRRANYWYLKQVASLALAQALGGSLLKQALILSSSFVIAAGTWLGVMENILKHSGYAERTAIAAGIAIQGIATLLFCLLNGGLAFRILVATGAMAILFVGGSAVINSLSAPHFEGFVIVIGAALIVEALLTFAAVLRSRQRAAA